MRHRALENYKKSISWSLSAPTPFYGKNHLIGECRSYSMCVLMFLPTMPVEHAKHMPPYPVFLFDIVYGLVHQFHNVCNVTYIVTYVHVCSMQMLVLIWPWIMLSNMYALMSSTATSLFPNDHPRWPGCGFVTSMDNLSDGCTEPCVASGWQMSSWFHQVRLHEISPRDVYERYVITLLKLTL